MAEIKFYNNLRSVAIGSNPEVEPDLIEHTLGSGLGFFGGAFGISVPVNEYQDTTYYTNDTGTGKGYQLSNTKYDDTLDGGATERSGVVVNGASIGNSGLPNYQCPLNIRFTHSEEVAVQNCRLRIFDRSDIDTNAQGVETQVYEARHPHPEQVFTTDVRSLALRGLGTDHGWVEYVETTPASAPSDMVLTSSPGASGLNTAASDNGSLPATHDGFKNWVTAEGEAHRSIQHDWYIALSASPTSIGSKTDYGLYFTLEYL